MVEKWSKDIEALAEIAATEPQLASVAYTSGISHRWESVCRTTHNISSALKPLDQLIEERLIPARGKCYPDLIKLFSLPTRTWWIRTDSFIRRSCSGI